MNWALKLQGRRRNLQELVLFGLVASFSAQDVAKLITTPIFAGYYNLY